MRRRVFFLVFGWTGSQAALREINHVLKPRSDFRRELHAIGQIKSLGEKTRKLFSAGATVRLFRTGFPVRHHQFFPRAKESRTAVAA